MALKVNIIGMLNRRLNGGILLIVLILFSVFFLTYNFGLNRQQEELRFLKLQKLSTQVAIMEVMAKRYLEEKNLKGEGTIRFENGQVEYYFLQNDESRVALKIFPDSSEQSHFYLRKVKIKEK